MAKLLLSFSTSHPPKLRKLSERLGEQARDKLRVAYSAVLDQPMERPSTMSEETYEDLLNVFSGVLLSNSSTDRVVEALAEAKQFC